MFAQMGVSKQCRPEPVPDHHPSAPRCVKLEVVPQLLPEGEFAILFRRELLRFLQVPPPPGQQINLLQPPVSRLEGDLVAEVDKREERQEDVGVDKITRNERRESAPTLHQGKEDVGAKTEVGKPG